MSDLVGLLAGKDWEARRLEQEARERVRAREISEMLDAVEKEGTAANQRIFWDETLPRIYFERKLLEFALARGITLLHGSDWRLPALWFAAKDHPNLQIGPLPKPPKKRGRKPKWGLLTPRGLHPRAREEYLAVRKIMRNKSISQAEACRILAFHDFGAQITDSNRHQAMMDAKQIENHIGQYKKLVLRTSLAKSRNSVIGNTGSKRRKKPRI